MRRGPIIALAVVVGALAGCGGGSGGSDNSKQTLLDGYRALLEKSGVPPSVAQCYADKVGALPGPEFTRFLAESKQQALTPDLVRLNLRFRQECVPAGSQAINPSASSAAIQQGRASLIRGMTPVLKAQGATVAQIGCMSQQVNDLPDSRVVAFANSPSRARGLLHAMALQCGGH